MSIGIIGRKCGMMRIFTEDGASIPVSVVEIPENKVAQIKTIENDGYRALQISVGVAKASRVNKPQAGHFAKAGISASPKLVEFRLDESEGQEIELGHKLAIDDIFKAGQEVDVTGKSKGKGFAGVVKRHNFSTQDATHGNSLSHRAPGSIGQCQTPGRVFKGKKMAGRMGNVKRTVQNLEVIRVDAEKNLLLIKGAIPGAKTGYVVIKSAAKKSAVKAA